MKQFKNKQKIEFLKGIPKASLDDDNDKLTYRMKFNFGYFSSNINDCTENQLKKLYEKLKHFSRESLEHWKHQEIGTGVNRGRVCAIYGDYPNNSNLSKPKSVPHQALWGRFRIDQSVRLCGFVIPDDFHQRIHSKTGEYFDRNTFYVVFYDPEHDFYPC